MGIWSHGASRLSGLWVEGQLEIGVQEPRKLQPDLSDDVLLRLAKNSTGLC